VEYVRNIINALDILHVRGRLALTCLAYCDG